MAVASNSSTQKKRYTVTALVFITLFLFTIFLFSKRALEPSLSLYKNPFPQIPSSSSSSLPNSNLSLPNSTSTERVAVDPPSSSGSTYQLPLLHPISSQPVDPPTQQPVSSNSQTEEPTEFNDETEQDPVRENENPFGEMGETGCDLYLGTWVKDEHYPLYKPSSCPYVDEAFDCQSNGRSDSEYLKWRWKPEGCDLPRYLCPALVVIFVILLCGYYAFFILVCCQLLKMDIIFNLRKLPPICFRKNMSTCCN